MSLVTFPRNYAADLSGVPRVGAKAYFYQPGTTTPITVYTTATYGTAHASPVESTGTGLFPAIYVNPAVNSTYKISVYDASNSLVYENDNVPAGTSRPDVGVVLYPRTTAEISAGVTPSDYAYPTGDIRRYGAACDGVTDDAAAVQAAVDSSKEVRLYGEVLIESTIEVNREHRVFGGGIVNTKVLAQACDAFAVRGLSGGVNGNGCTFENFTLINLDAMGAADARLNVGILCEGTATDTVSFFAGKKLYFQGFATGIDWRYTWNSTVDDIDTVNCDVGLRLFGQSVNNSVSNSRLVVNSGDESILLEADGSTIGEGLMVSNTLLASGNYAVRCTNGFLSFAMSACVVDLIQDIAFKLVDCRKFSVGQSWVYATNKCVELAALAGPENVCASFDGCHMRITGTGRVLDIGANSLGVSVTGGSLTAPTGAYLVYSAVEIALSGVFGISPDTPAYYATASGEILLEGCTGNVSVQHASGVPSSPGKVLAVASFPGATGTLAAGYGCTTSRGSTGTYTVTFSSALSSAQYVTIISLRRSGQNSVTWEFSGSPATTGFSFETRDASGTLFDPTDVYIAVMM